MLRIGTAEVVSPSRTGRRRDERVVSHCRHVTGRLRASGRSRPAVAAAGPRSVGVLTSNP